MKSFYFPKNLTKNFFSNLRFNYWVNISELVTKIIFYNKIGKKVMYILFILKTRLYLVDYKNPTEEKINLQTAPN